MFSLSRIGKAVRILFLKAEQFALFDAPVQVGQSITKQGVIRRAHTRIQKVRPQQAPVQGSLFGGGEKPAQADLFSDDMVVSRKEMIREHEHLIHVLDTPSHADDKVEAKKQSEELKEYKEDGDERMSPVEAAKYLKDFVYSLDQLEGMTNGAQVILSSPLGKSGRDSLLMEAFGISRDQAHEINNRLDSRSPHKLRAVDMEDAFKVFPALRKMVDKAIADDKAREERKTASTPNSESPAVPKFTGRDEFNVSLVGKQWKKMLDAGDKTALVRSVEKLAEAMKRGSVPQSSEYMQLAKYGMTLLQHMKGSEPATESPKEAPAVVADKPEFDVSGRTDDQLRYLTEKGRPGWKEAAVAELAQRGISADDAKIKPVDEEIPQKSAENETRDENSGGDSWKEGKSGPGGMYRSWDRGGENIIQVGARSFMASNADAPDSPSNTFRTLDEAKQASEKNSLLRFGAIGKTKQQRVELNNQARAIVERGGPFSDDDKAVLRQYSGNGGCGDSLNEFYTLPEVAGAMWSVMRSLGVKGDVLEPSCGPGVFLHTAPADCRVTGIELDTVSSKIAKALHGDRHEIQNASLERFATQDDRQFDGVIGNVPFGLRGGLIKDDKPKLKTAEAYFCDTAMDKCKAGGIVGLIVPTGIMDSKGNRNLREMLLRKGQFLGAQRMPNTAFEHTHTGVTTDVIWLRKRPDDMAGALSSPAVSQDDLKALGVWDENFLAGRYFFEGGAGNVLGKMGDGWRAKAGMGADITVEGSMQGVPEAIAGFKPDDGGAMPSVTQIIEGKDEADKAKVLGAAMSRPYANKAKVGDTKEVDGVVYVLQGKPPRWHRIDEVLQSEALTQGQDIAGRIDTLLSGRGAVDRPQLEADVRAWIEAHGVPSKNKDVLLGARQDKTLYRLIGAVKSDGSLSDAILGKVAKREHGSFEATIRTLLADRDTIAVDNLAKAAEVDSDEALDQLFGSNKYAVDPASGEWTTKDIYLSGDLWAKSDAVKAALSGELSADMRRKLEWQGAELTQAIAPITLDEVFIQMNSAFVPPALLGEFFTEKNKNGSKWQQDLPPVKIAFEDGTYVLSGGSLYGTTVDGVEQYGDLKYLAKYLNRTGLKKDDKPRIDELNMEFKEWLCASKHREEVEDLYNRKFRGFAEREFSNEPMDLPGLNAEGLKDYQWGGLRWALNAGKGIIAADVGLGKAQPLDSKILTPSGWVLMGDIKVGDEVIAGDGSVTAVTGVFPQGEKDIFKVVMSDGATTECCDEHLWLTQTHLDRNNQRRNCADKGVPKVRSLAQIRISLTYRGMKNHAIPMVGAVEFVAKEVPLDPYLLGVMIGDGGLSKYTPIITNPEPEILKAIEATLPVGYVASDASYELKCPAIRIRREEVSGKTRNMVCSIISEMGLKVYSHEKFIPDVYKFNSQDVRLAILNGLMDTDGYVDKNGVTVQFTSASEQLANDVQFLTQSLGGNATISSKIPTYTYKGEKKQGRRAYTVHLRLPPSVAPFLHSKKRDRVKPKSKYLPIRYIVDAIPVGKKPAQCIAVAHESHLYVTDDFIVTHNTSRAILLNKALKLTGKAKRPMIVVPKSVLSNWFAECNKWFPGCSVLTIGGEFEMQPDGSFKGKDDNADDRRRKYHDLQQNDYDFIICSEPAFEEISLSPSVKDHYDSMDFWAQRKDSLEGAKEKKKRKIQESWEQGRADQEFNDADRTDAVYFDQLGVDALIADEVHHHKNLVGVRSRFGEQPKFLGAGKTSKRALDFNQKSRWLLDNHGNKGSFGLTATPSKNSPMEIYSMLSHFAPEAFEQIGVRNGEEFLDRFARFEDGMALDTKGVVEDALVTVGFQNMDELRAIMRRFIHRQTADDVGLKLPTRNDVQHFIDMDAEQQAKYSELRDLAEESGGKDATGDAHIFSIMDKMNKAATDLSLVDPDYDGAKSPKYVACADEILKRMKDGGQIVFSDYVDAHEKIAQALVARGIPRSQIGIINAKAAPSSDKRQKITDQFNAGKFKVVIGNTATMGEGLNLQKGTSDIHHLDLPWEPASMQQRNGRGLRQGNTNEGVRIHQYLSKGSFDGYRMQAILAKKDWQDTVWNGGDSVENLNQPKMSREEMNIMLAADPDQAREAYEANRAEKEARYAAGKTADASERFVKFQELKRSYSSLSDKNTPTAQRLKVKIDKESSVLRADKYFTAKQALNMETPVIVAPSGSMLFAGAGVESDEGGERVKWVVTEVDPRRDNVTMRKYGDEQGLKRTVGTKGLSRPTNFEFNEAEESAEIAKKIAERPLEIKNLEDAYKIPPAVLADQHEKIQQYLWDGLKDYKIHAFGNVALVNKETGKIVSPAYYNLGGKGDYTRDKYDIFLPTPENMKRLESTWKDERRNATFSTKIESIGNKRSTKTKTTAIRHYQGADYSSKHINPVRTLLNKLSGHKDWYSSSGLSSTERRLKAEIEAEQIEKVKHAKTFADALKEAVPTGSIMNGDLGYSARVKYPKKVLATLWAKARRLGVLGEKMSNHTTKTEKGFGAHDSYAFGGYDNEQSSVHSALLGMSTDSRHHDLTHAMVESGLRHHKQDAAGHLEALRAIDLDQGYMLTDPDHIKATHKLAEAAGMLDKKRSELPDGLTSMRSAYSPGGYYATYGNPKDANQTVRDYLAEKLEQAQNKATKEAA